MAVIEAVTDTISSGNKAVVSWLKDLSDNYSYIAFSDESLSGQVVGRVQNAFNWSNSVGAQSLLVHKDYTVNTNVAPDIEPLRLGSFEMPLNISYSIKATRKLAQSQLIDGINIIERINNAPRTLSVELEFLRSTGIYDENPYLTISQNDAQTATTTAISNLSVFFKELMTSNQAIVINNTQINNELNFYYGVLMDYNIQPEVGSKFIRLTMTIMEIDIENVVIDNTNPNATQQNKAGIPVQL